MGYHVTELLLATPFRLTAITQLTHHGMVFVPVGYTFGAKLFGMDQVQGGSPYGAGTFAADGSRWPSEVELEHAFHRGSTSQASRRSSRGLLDRSALWLIPHQRFKTFIYRYSIPSIAWSVLS